MKCKITNQIMKTPPAALFTMFGPLLAASLLLAPVKAPAAEDFFLKDGDRVVLLGDSITQMGIYTAYLEQWINTRFPDRNISFFNVGIGGQRSPQGNERFKRDVLAYAPTVLLVNFGMNDGGYVPFTEPNFKRYMDGLQSIADQAKAANIRVAWCTSSAVEPKPQRTELVQYNQTLERFAEGIQQIAARNGNALFIDQFHPYLSAITQARAADPQSFISGGGDSVHPGRTGAVLMAWSILKGMNFPRVAAAAELDAAAGRVLGNENCTIDGVQQRPDGGIVFQQKDAVLPYFPEAATAVMKWAPGMEEFNAYRLKVTGLKPGQYQVCLGGESIAKFTADQLAKGVNLAPDVNRVGPIAKQLNAITNAIQAKNVFFHQIFSDVSMPVPGFLKTSPQEVDTQRTAYIQERLKELPSYETSLRKALTITPHQVEIVPAQP